MATEHSTGDERTREAQRLNLWPVAILEDRYNGVYAGGKWIAVARATDFDRREGADRLRIVLTGAHGDDTDAAEFWWSDETPPRPWLAVANSPEQALAKLYEQNNA